MTSTLDFPYKEDVGGSIPSAPTGISRSARPLTGGSARSLRKSERQESGRSFRYLFQRRTYTARERWMRTAMQNLLWSGLGATMLGLVGGLKAITGPVQGRRLQAGTADRYGGGRDADRWPVAHPRLGCGGRQGEGPIMTDERNPMTNEWADPGSAAGGQVPSFTHFDETAPPTAWQSLPKPVRFAVWLWTVAVIASFVAGVVMAVSFVLGMGLALL